MICMNVSVWHVSLMVMEVRSLKVELPTAMICHMCAGTQTQILEEETVLFTAEPSLQPQVIKLLKEHQNYSHKRDMSISEYGIYIL